MSGSAELRPTLKDPRPTLKDVAKAAGVSPQAVSLVINNKRGVSQTTRRHIESVVRDLNYTPHAGAQAMRSASTRTLAFIYSGTTSGRLSVSGYLEEILNGVLASANGRGYHLLLYSLHLGQGEQQLSELRSRCDGIIAVGSHLSDAQLRTLEAIRLPYAEVQRKAHTHSAHAYSVCVDDEGGIGAAVGYLSRRGHKRIGYLGRVLTKHTSQARYQGYLAGLEKNSLVLDEAIVRHADRGETRPGAAVDNPLEQHEVSQGLELSLELLGEAEPPTALVCFDDLLAVGALRAAKLRGVAVPGDLAVIGFNNFSMAAATTPPLTTIDFPAYQLGTTAADLLHQHLAGEPPETRAVTIPVKLFTRETA